MVGGRDFPGSSAGSQHGHGLPVVERARLQRGRMEVCVEGNPVGEGTTRRGTATTVHRLQRPADSTHSSTRGLSRGSGAGTLGVPLGGTRRVGGLLGVAGRLSVYAEYIMRNAGMDEAQAVVKIWWEKYQ